MGIVILHFVLTWHCNEFIQKLKGTWESTSRLHGNIATTLCTCMSHCQRCWKLVSACAACACHLKLSRNSVLHGKVLPGIYPSPLPLVTWKLIMAITLITILPKRGKYAKHHLLWVLLNFWKTEKNSLILKLAFGCLCLINIWVTHIPPVPSDSPHCHPEIYLCILYFVQYGKNVFPF